MSFRALTAKQINLVFIIIATFLTIGMATRWSFNLFEPQFLWKAYNYYFLSIINGHLDIPVEAIGSEGGYFNSKAYMYYGLLPTLVRAVLHPFVDLTQTPVSYFSVLLFTLLGHTALQISLVNFYLKKRNNINRSIATYSLFGISALLWFGSASFMISQNATIYHEPYAASLCLMNVFFALLIKDEFFLKNVTNISLLPYAIIAGLCIHARMPSALAMYLALGLIILIQSYRISSLSTVKPSIVNAINQGLKSYWLSILILGACGISILWLNYAKYNNPLSFMGGNYGYFFFEGYTERTCNFYPKTQFSNYVRIIPNTVVYLTGSWDLHWSLSWHLATGYGRKELPLIPLLILWPLPLFCFSFLIFHFSKNIRIVKNKLLLVGLLTFSVGAFFQLKYPTIAHRYIAEFWSPLFISVLFCSYTIITNSSDRLVKTKVSLITYTTVGLLLFTGLCYQLYLANTNEYYLADGPSYSENFHFNEKANSYLRSLTPEKIAAYRENFRKNYDDKCKEAASELNIELDNR